MTYVLQCDYSNQGHPTKFSTNLNVAKCNLGKVNLKAMLSSWMQKACPAAPATVRTIYDAYTLSLLYAGAQSFGAAQALRKDTL